MIYMNGRWTMSRNLPGGVTFDPNGLKAWSDTTDSQLLAFLLSPQEF